MCILVLFGYYMMLRKMSAQLITCDNLVDDMNVVVVHLDAKRFTILASNVHVHVHELLQFTCNFYYFSVTDLDP